MIFFAIILTLAAALFAYAEWRRQRWRGAGWGSLAFFFGVGVDVEFFSFSATNAVLAYTTENTETKNWSGDFASLSAIIGTALAVLLAIAVAIYKPGFKARDLAIGSICLLILSTIAMLVLSKIPNMNWF